MLSVSEQFVQGLIDQGKLKSFPLGNRLRRIPDDSVRQYLKSLDDTPHTGQLPTESKENNDDPTVERNPSMEAPRKRPR
jgi:excisionase family DNA binding protein